MILVNSPISLNLVKAETNKQTNLPYLDVQLLLQVLQIKLVDKFCLIVIGEFSSSFHYKWPSISVISVVADKTQNTKLEYAVVMHPRALISP